MTRNPKSKENDAWKRWLREGWRLFDRTWSGWTLVWWLFSLGCVYALNAAPNILVVGFLCFASAAAFGMHIAVFDILARGKRGQLPWMMAAWKDLRVNSRIYARTGLIRAAVAIGCILLLGTILLGLIALLPSAPETAAAPHQPFWKSWIIWAWVWMIPSGWQMGGALGWGHWLIRREGADPKTAELLTRLGIAMNARSYSLTIGILMMGSIILMFVFPPLMPVWDVYVAAVCWCVWDDVFGNGDGLKEMERKTVFSGTTSVVGA